MSRENTNCLAGMRCPKCRSLGAFVIAVTASATVYDDGTDDITDVEWEGESGCVCKDCGHAATVNDFREGEV